MVRSFIFPVVALASVAGAARAQDADSLPAQAVRLIEGGPRQWFGGTRKTIAAIFGRPDSVEVRLVSNRHDSRSIDSIVTWHYPAASMVFYVVTRSHSDLLREGTIGDARYLKQSPLRLGATAPQVRAFFHDPSSGSTPHMLYSTESELTHTLELWFEDDRLVRLRWVYPLD
jgi:hypothetical protein